MITPIVNIITPMQIHVAVRVIRFIKISVIL